MKTFCFTDKMFRKETMMTRGIKTKDSLMANLDYENYSANQEIMTIDEFSRIAKDRKDLIKRVKFIPPSRDDNELGYFVVTYKRPNYWFVENATY